MTRVALLDYGCGNIGSVAQAFDYLGFTPLILRSGNEIAGLDFSHLVLPGVGAFEQASTGLRTRHLHEVITAHLQKQRPFLGICVGMQVLMETGYEFGVHPGLGLFKGSTRHLQEISPNATCPHIGWDRVNFLERSSFALLNREDLFFYFNHSYVCQPEDLDCIAARCQNGQSLWPAAIEKDNIIAIQCHPEKSHQAGLSFLRRFVEI